MALSRCNKCGLLSEHGREAVGTQIACPRCATAVPVYDSVFFVGRLLEQFFAQRQELLALRAAAPVQEAGSATSSAGHPAESPASPLPAIRSDEVDLHDSDRLSSPEQHRGVVDWFRAKNIAATINAAAVDTSGFFDEAAADIGANFRLFGEVCERIRFAQQKEYQSTLIHLDRKANDDAAAITEFCQRLYRYSLVARCMINREERNLRLVLQNAPGVRRFFAGEWLEWCALMVALRVCDDRELVFSCARNLTLAIGDERREIDVFFLVEGRKPLCIECKSGEFRDELDKYVALRKRLGIDAKQFVVCVADLDAEQARGLSATHGLTFVNTKTLGPHLGSLL